MRSNLLLAGSCYPQPNELLSSWVSRLALNHGMAPLVFWRRLYPSATFEYRLSQRKLVDMDRYQLPELYNLLAMCTATPLEWIHDTTLWDYRLFDKDEEALPTSPSSVHNWWLSFNWPFATDGGFSFCASCLRKDSAHPYFRKSWRFWHTVACLDCGVLLANGCLRCRSGIDYRELNAKLSTQTSLKDLALNLATCQSCGYNLVQTPVKSAAPVVIALQQKLNRIWLESLTRPNELTFKWLKQIINALVDLNRNELKKVVPACLLIWDRRGEEPLDQFDNFAAAHRARLLYQAMVFLGEGWEEFCQLYAQYAHQYRPMYYCEEPPMYGFLTYLSKCKPSNWMSGWSAFGPTGQ